MDINVAYFYIIRVSLTTVALLIGILAICVLDDRGILQRYTKKNGKYICMCGVTLYLINLLYCVFKAFIYYI